MAINKTGNSLNGIQNSRFRISHNHNIISIMTCVLLMTAPLVTYGSAWEALSPTHVCSASPPQGKEGYWTSAPDFFQDVQCQIDTNPPPQLPVCQELSPDQAPSTANGIITSKYDTNPSSSTSCQKETILSEHRCADPKENLVYTSYPDTYAISCVANQCNATQVWDEKTQVCVTPRLPVDLLKNMCSTGLCGTGNPINQATGNKYQIETDYLGAGPYPLRFIRYYNSIESITSTRIGEHWRHYYDRSITEVDATTVNIYRHDGKVLTFTLSGGTWSPDADVVLTLVEETNGWTLTTEDDSVESYDDNGKLIFITNRTGFTHTLDYEVTSANGGDDNSSTLDKVTGHFGRTLLLSYDANGRIDTMTDPAGEDYTFTYDIVDRLKEVIYPDDDPNNNPTRTYHYESSYHPRALTGITDENENRFASWGYDNDTGMANYSEHAGGAERVDLVYNANGTTQITDALGNVQTQHFDTTNGTAQSSQIDGDKCNTCGNQYASSTYDTNGFIASRTDFNNNLTKFENNTRGLEECRIEAFGEVETRMTKTTWDNTYRLPLTITLFAPPAGTLPGDPDLSPVDCVDPETDYGWIKHKTTTLTYDEGRLETRTETDHVSNPTKSRTTTNTYYGPSESSPEGLLKQIDGPRTDVTDTTTFDYDSSGNLIKTTNALGHVTDITSYDDHGRPLTIEDPNGTITTLTYDARGRLLTRVVDNKTTTFEYDDVGNIKKTILPNSSYLENTYDVAQRLEKIEDNVGNTITYTLDAMGNRKKEEVKDIQPELKRQFDREYNTLNQLKKTTGGEGQVSEYLYDDNGNQKEIKVTVQTTPTLITQITTQDYDALNRLIKSTDANLKDTLFDYDARDNLVKVTDPMTLETIYTYDGLDNLIQQDSPDTKQTTYEYDDAGNRTKQTDAEGIITTYTYDALNRLTAITYPEPSPGVPNPQNVSFTYDSDSTVCNNGIGRLCEMSDESGTTHYDYDARGNLTQQTITIDSIAKTISYAYNDADQLTQITYPSGRVVTYNRNTLGQIDQVSQNVEGNIETLVQTLSYAPFGPMTSLTYVTNGTGVTYTLDYDNSYRIADILAGTYIDRTYTLDDANNITHITNNLDSNRNQVFDYDLLNRLKQADGVYGLLDYTYDDNGNRLTEDIDNNSLKTYTYNTGGIEPSHYLLQTVNGGTVTYQYDDKGNTTSNTDYDFVYGDNNRLKEAQISATPQGTYTYNGRGERVKKDASGITYYYYDQAGQLLAELDQNGNFIQEYVYLDGRMITILTSNTGPQVDNPIADQNVNEDSPFNFTIPANTFSDPDGDPLTYVATLDGGGNLPGWLSFDNNPAAPTFSGTPVNNDVGSISIKVTVTDTDEQSIPDTFTLTVNNTNDAPTVVAPNPNHDLDIGETLNHEVLASTFDDVDVGDTRSYSATLEDGSNLPGWLDFNMSTRVFNGTPNAIDVGNYVVHAKLTDGAGASVFDRFVITVREAGGNGAQASGNEFQTNTTTTSYQDQTRVAGLTGGGFVVVWRSNLQDGDDYGVFGQRYDSGGFAQGSEFQVNTFTSNDQDDVAITGLSDGSFVVVWESLFQDGGSSDWDGIYAQRYSATGTALGSEFRVNTTTTSDQDTPDVAALDGGGFVVVWHSWKQESSTSKYGVYGQRYDNSGNTIDSEFHVNTYTNDNQQDARVAGLNGGGFVVVWESAGQDGSLDGVYGQRFDNSGAAAGNEFRVNTTTASRQNTADITALDGGGFVVVWKSLNQDGSGAGIYGQRYDNSGNTVGTEFLVNTETSGTQRDPSVAGLDDGSFVVTWESDGQDGSNYGVYAQRFDSNGNTMDSEFLVNTHTLNDQASPDISALSDGGFVVAWRSNDQDGDLTGVFAQRYIIGANNPPFVDNPIPDQNIDEYSTLDYTLPADTFGDVDEGDSLSYTATLHNDTALPNWLTFDAETQTFSGTPLINDVGSDDIKVTAIDNGGLSASDIFTLTVNSIPNHTPEVNVPIPDQQVDESTAYSYTVPTETFTEHDGDPLDYSALLADGSSLPTWLTFNTTTRELSTAGTTEVGNYFIGITATDPGAESATAIFMLTIGTPITTPEASGSEFRANTTTSQNQTRADVTGLSGGGFVVVWNSWGHDGSLWGMYGQRYDEMYSAIGSEFQINTTTASYQDTAALADLDDGGFVVVWESWDQDGSDNGVYGQRYDSNGITSGNEFRINTETNGDQRDVDIVTLTNGGLVVTWESHGGQDGSGIGVFSQRYDNSGNTLGNEFQVNTTTSGDQENARVADLSEGGFVVVWESNGQDGSGEGVYGQRFNSSGTAVGAEFQVNTTTSSDQDTPDVASLSTGGFIVVWESANQDGSVDGIYGQRYDSSGNALGNEFQVNTTTSSDQDLAVVAGLDDGFVVVWESYLQDGSDDGVYGQRYDNNGNAVGNEFQVNSHTTNAQGNPDVTLLDQGELLVAWESNLQDGDAFGIYAQVFEVGGNLAPYLDTGKDLPDQTADEGLQFSYAIAADSFKDDDIGDVLSYTATQSDGSALPTWLSFDADTQTFSGTPGSGDVGSITVNVTVSDLRGAVATDAFTLTVNASQAFHWQADVLYGQAGEDWLDIGDDIATRRTVR